VFADSLDTCGIASAAQPNECFSFFAKMFEMERLGLMHATTLLPESALWAEGAQFLIVAE
jgi:hypothetical protein